MKTRHFFHAVDSLVGFFQILPYLLHHPQLVVSQAKQGHI
jgi:hypothetical protein